jgi:hypothetical protein
VKNRSQFKRILKVAKQDVKKVKQKNVQRKLAKRMLENNCDKLSEIKFINYKYIYLI